MGCFSHGSHQFFVRCRPVDLAEKRCPYALVGVAVGIALVVLSLLLVWISRPPERFRVIGLTFFMAACGCLTLAIGSSRRRRRLGTVPLHCACHAAVQLCLCNLVLVGGGQAARLVQIIVLCGVLYSPDHATWKLR